MKFEKSLRSGIFSGSIFLAAIIFLTIFISGCAGKEGETSGNAVAGHKSNGVEGSIFWAPTVEISGTVYNPAYYYFYSADSCFIIYGGTTNGFTKSYTQTSNSVTIKFGPDKGEIKYQLLGDQVLMDNGRSFFKVESFSSAFQGNVKP